MSLVSLSLCILTLETVVCIPLLELIDLQCIAIKASMQEQLASSLQPKLSPRWIIANLTFSFLCCYWLQLCMLNTPSRVPRHHKVRQSSYKSRNTLHQFFHFFEETIEEYEVVKPNILYESNNVEVKQNCCLARNHYYSVFPHSHYIHL